MLLVTYVTSRNPAVRSCEGTLGRYNKRWQNLSVIDVMLLWHETICSIGDMMPPVFAWISLDDISICSPSRVLYSTGIDIASQRRCTRVLCFDHMLYVCEAELEEAVGLRYP